MKISLEELNERLEKEYIELDFYEALFDLQEEKAKKWAFDKILKIIKKELKRTNETLEESDELKNFVLGQKKELEYIKEKVEKNIKEIKFTKPK